MWKPTKSRSNAVDDDVLGAYIPHAGTWCSTWEDEQNSIEVTGYGDRPTKTQKESWLKLLPLLDEAIRAANESIPPPPKPRIKWFFFSQTAPVLIDDRKLQLELLDDGTHTILFPSVCIIDGESFRPLVEMRGVQIILSEWSN